MKLSEIETCYANAAKAKKLFDEIAYLQEMRRRLEENCPFEIAVLFTDSVDAGLRVLGTHSRSDIRSISATAQCRIVEILTAEIDTRLKEIASL